MTTATLRRVRPGDTIELVLPFSEVCIHMQVAGRRMKVRVLEHGAQLLNEDFTAFSFPINHGEAGLYRDAKGLYSS